MTGFVTSSSTLGFCSNFAWLTIGFAAAIGEAVPPMTGT